MSEEILNREKWGDSKYAHAHDAHILPNGFRSGRLVVVEHLGSNRHNKFIYKCHCDCGGISIVCGSPLKNKRITRCKGCSGRESALRITHAHYNEFYYRKRAPMLENILTLRSDHTLKEIAQFIPLDSRTIGQICVDHGMGGYLVIGRGAPGIKRKKT